MRCGVSEGKPALIIPSCHVFKQLSPLHMLILPSWERRNAAFDSKVQTWQWKYDGPLTGT
jgi:hypothetical protein